MRTLRPSFVFFLAPALALAFACGSSAESSRSARVTTRVDAGLVKAIRHYRVATWRLQHVMGGTIPVVAPLRHASLKRVHLVWRQRAAFGRLERPWLQLLRMVLSTAEVAAFFVAVVYLPLADVITYYLACPIFVTALSAIILREQVGWRRWSAVVVGFCGVLIALQPSAQTVSWPALIALAGSFCFAVLMIVTRSLRATPDIVLAATQFAGTFSVGLVLAPFAWRTPGLPDLGLFVLAGCISIVALLCTNRSLKLAPASVVVPYQYSMIVWAVMFGYVVFGDVPQVSTIVGAAIIIGAGLYIFIREQQLGRGEAEISPPVV